ncbi:cell cycle and apoptosis regulator protein 2 isoform X1 [Phaenicophaeus curvirostris]|uniref:cell cycle and apoptosis regulator protein 2 isoform X1 n=1 Tax=Phaenicophaeus curvirostris TaxID=33595 RepID=UPI0037F0FEB1
MVAELFQEMLQQDFGYKHYKALLVLLKEELVEARNPEPERASRTVKEAEQTLGLPQRHSAPPGTDAGESGATSSTWRAKSTCWRASWIKNRYPTDLHQQRAKSACLDITSWNH